MQSYAPQLHLIAGERPCLVAEHIFHHTKILHHVSVPGFCKLATCLMLHFPIEVNVQSLQQSQCLAWLQMAQRYTTQVMVQSVYGRPQSARTHLPQQRHSRKICKPGFRLKTAQEH